MAVATLINWLKFGVLSPISYGRSDGFVSLDHYFGLLVLGALGVLITVALAFRRVRAIAYRPDVMAATASLMVAVVVLLPSIQAPALQFLDGLWILLVDLQHYALIDHEAYGLSPVAATLDPQGTLKLFGFVKKALLQSMPYLAVLLLLLPYLFKGPSRAQLVFGFLVVGAVALPFAQSAWHGGMANNMRYFLHALPMWAVLAAAGLLELKRQAGHSSSAAMLAACAVGVLGVVFLFTEGPPDGRLLQVDVPLILAGGIALLSLTMILGKPIRTITARICYIFVGVALGLSFINGYIIDLQRSQAERELNWQGARLTSDVPANAIVVTYSAGALAMRLNRPPAVTLQIDFRTRRLEPEVGAVIADAHGKSRPVVADSREVADLILSHGLAGEAVELLQARRSMLFLMTTPE
jgi:hypothetical protein